MKYQGGDGSNDFLAVAVFRTESCARDEVGVRRLSLGKGEDTMTVRLLPEEVERLCGQCPAGSKCLIDATLPW